jgi:hypothetical protein
MTSVPEQLMIALSAVLIALLGVGFLSGAVYRAVFRYRVAGHAVETTLLGFVIDRIRYSSIAGPDQVRVSTNAELWRTGELWRAGNVGSRGIQTRAFGKMVVITRRTGDVTLITPDAPEAFVQEMRERIIAMYATIEATRAPSSIKAEPTRVA